jgi:polyisoprenoid-binding protein YceI
MPLRRDTVGCGKEAIMQAQPRDGALAGEWVLDPRTSSVALKSRAMGGLVPVTGVFREVSGNGTIDENGTAGGTITVAAASIDTRNARRDTHLRSADFFDSDNYPDITFTADGVRPTDEGVTVTGALTVRGRTRFLSLDVAADVRGGSEIRLDAQVRINRADFGLTWNLLGLTSMTNTLTIHAVFARR